MAQAISLIGGNLPPDVVTGKGSLFKKSKREKLIEAIAKKYSKKPKPKPKAKAKKSTAKRGRPRKVKSYPLAKRPVKKRTVGSARRVRRRSGTITLERNGYRFKSEKKPNWEYYKKTKAKRRAKPKAKPKPKTKSKKAPKRKYSIKKYQRLTKAKLQRYKTALTPSKAYRKGRKAEKRKRLVMLKEKGIHKYKIKHKRLLVKESRQDVKRWKARLAEAKSTKKGIIKVGKKKYTVE